jgi:hypothetical protein
MKKGIFVVSLAILTLALGILVSQNTEAKKAKTIPKLITRNKYGFLSAGSRDTKDIKKSGALWVRPHPGPFLWDSSQSSSGAAYDFSGMDKIVRKYSFKKIGILATLWPFAEWDQANNPNFESCAVSDKDEFLQGNRDKEGKVETGSYLPRHRCQPTDWDAYSAWVRAVVERYDGDGVNDMPKLKYPIKYWEVMNEPDLDGEDTLDFWKGDADDYAKLLEETSLAVKSADPSAQVLIAGAAGGDDRFLDFYRTLFSSHPGISSNFDIANVHCISNDSYENFNVEPYKNMLAEFGLDGKSIWVTEAEAMISDDAKVNAQQTYDSTKNARALGAQRIFFTQYDFGGKMKQKDVKKWYKRITRL